MSEEPAVPPEGDRLPAEPDHSAGSQMANTMTREPSWRPRRRVVAERVLGVGSGVAALVPLAGLVAAVAVLLVEALPAIRYNGWHFITGSGFNPGNLYGKPVHTGGVLHFAGASYGAFPLIIGTIESAAIAVVVACPIAIGAAVLIVEKLPGRIANVVGFCLEVLAGIPSVVFGLWGVLTFGPWLSHNIYPALAHLPNFPPFSIFRGNTGYGQGLLSAGLVLAVMIIPIVAATTRDLLRQVPAATKEGAEALGMTDAEVFQTVQLRWVRTGVIGAIVLGLGRALGETIAVALVSGSILQTSSNIYGNMTTIAATIVSQLDAANTDTTGLEVKTLAEAALVLFLITVLVNIGARLLVRRSARGAALPVGAGF
ncbi:MAG: phosphate transport system permease protein pstC 1 [Acidimicrobiaceae bacterium]|jgi:phosphate transport system permease protein|nr:phosphate transport system permease protein pstC 1 [Acidimicrobiaceae bacterium]